MEKKRSKFHLEKEKTVKKLAEQIKNFRTLMIVSIKNLPSRQFQEIKKSIRDYASVSVTKKNIMLRTIKKLDRESILPLKDYIKEDCAFAISNMEGFELAGLLSKKKTPVFAKAGQIAQEDIEIKEGPTDLPPGPAISELGSVGLQVSVEEGKLSIKASKIVVRKGETINKDLASILQKLNMQPFKVGLEPLVVYDVEKEKIYTDIKIDSEFAVSELKSAVSKALGFAQNIVYYCKETIGYFLAKANSEMNALKKFEGKTEKKKEDVKEEKVEEKTEEKKVEDKEKQEEGKIQEGNREVSLSTNTQLNESEETA